MRIKRSQKDLENLKSAIGANRERLDWKSWFDIPEEKSFEMEQFLNLRWVVSVALIRSVFYR